MNVRDAHQVQQLIKQTLLLDSGHGEDCWSSEQKSQTVLLIRERKFLDNFFSEDAGGPCIAGSVAPPWGTTTSTGNTALHSFSILTECHGSRPAEGRCLQRGLCLASASYLSLSFIARFADWQSRGLDACQ